MSYVKCTDTNTDISKMSNVSVLQVPIKVQQSTCASKRTKVTMNLYPTLHNFFLASRHNAHFKFSGVFVVVN